MNKNKEEILCEIKGKEDNHSHNFTPYPDSSAIFCTKCGIQHLNINKAKLSVKNDSEESHMRLASLIPLVQKLQCLSASTIYNEYHS